MDVSILPLGQEISQRKHPKDGSGRVYFVLLKWKRTLYTTFKKYTATSFVSASTRHGTENVAVYFLNVVDIQCQQSFQS